MQIARVREFREKNLLLADDDFAGAFASFNAAIWSRMGKGSNGAESMPVAFSSMAPVKHPVARLMPGKESLSKWSSAGRLLGQRVSGNGGPQRLLVSGPNPPW